MVGDASPNDLEHPENAIDEIVNELDGIHKDLVEKSAKVGAARDAVRSIRPAWVELGNSVTDDPEAVAVLTSGYDVLQSVLGEIRYRRAQSPRFYEWVEQTADSALGLVSTTGSTASFTVSANTVIWTPVSPELLSLERIENLAVRLERLDADLGRTYREVGETLYGTRADSERAAAFLSRQTFDHFFDLLAPDNEVRESQFWTRKEGALPNQVWREERISYAVNRHVRDEARARTLVARARHTITVYKALNSAHKRGTLSRQKARAALGDMQAILEEWVDAIGI